MTAIRHPPNNFWERNYLRQA